MDPYIRYSVNESDHLVKDLMIGGHMSKIIATSTERMDNDISLYDQSITNLKTAFDDAWTALNTLNSTWTGPAHDTLMSQFGQDQEVMKALLTNLNNFRSELEEAKKEYERCENNVSSIIDGMNV